jgi:hypothetical protein
VVHLEIHAEGFGEVGGLDQCRNPAFDRDVAAEKVGGAFEDPRDVGIEAAERMSPAISQGRMSCGFLRDEFDIDTDKLPTYEHLYEYGRVIRAKACPQALWYLSRLLPKKPPLWGR